MSWTAETNIKGPKGDTGGIGEAPTDGQTYGRQNAAWNIVVSGGGTAASVTFTPAGNIAATNVQAAIAEVDTEKVAKAGDTMTGNLQINKANPSLVLQKLAAGQANQLAGYNGANPRWSLALGDSSAEGGSNAGSNFALYRYTDAGGLIDTPLTIARTSGAVTLTGALTLPADPTTALQAATKQYVDNKPGGAIVSDTAPVGAAAGALWWESDTGLFYVNYNDGDSTQWVMAVPLADATRYAVRFDTAQTLTAAQQAQARSNTGTPAANVLVNGDFRINQGGYVSAAVLAAAAYGHDQWKAGAGGGDYSFTQLPSSTQITIAAGKSLIQPIEDVRVVGSSYVLSWTGTAQARVGVNTLTPSGSYAASPLLISGQTAGTVMSVEFNTGILGTVKLESGSIASPFVMTDYSNELALCKRYFNKLPSQMFSGYNSTGGAVYDHYDFPVMRAVPTASFSNLTSVSNLTSLAVASTTSQNVSASCTITATGSGALFMDVVLVARL